MKNRTVSEKLSALFDFQRIAENPRLAKMIEDTESRYGTELSDDSLEFVSAAGETDVPQKKGKGGQEKR